MQNWGAKELLQLFEQIDLRNVVGEARFANISTEAGPKPLILIADDEKDLVNALEEFFEKSGYAVATAYNGVEAIEKINREKPRLILLDLMMPVMGGMETLRQIVSRQPHPEVILISALVDAEVAKLALRSGACDYLVKPFNADVLDQSIAACLAVADYRNRPWWKRWKA